MNGNGAFEYETAFSRNLGILDRETQARLRGMRVGLPGLGGVGGAHLQALARLGVGAFNLADPDRFEWVNVNRQLGASAGTLSRNKTRVAARMARGINPEADVRAFPEGLQEANLDAFLCGVSVVVDGLDFSAIGVRRALYAACRASGIPVVNAGPVGHGAILQVFLPGDPSFDEHFGIDAGMTEAEQLLAFMAGLGPALEGAIQPASLDFEGGKAPGLSTACFLCAALAGTEVVKLASGHGTRAAVPYGLFVDLQRLETRPLASAAGRRRGGLESAFRRFPSLRRMHESERKRRPAVTV
jgi:molybdopterin/thiamine biosynthesis adenylyltransferase